MAQLTGSNLTGRRRVRRGLITYWESPFNPLGRPANEPDAPCRHGRRDGGHHQKILDRQAEVLRLTEEQHWTTKTIADELMVSERQVLRDIKEARKVRDA